MKECISRGFHFLGIDYLPTRTEDNINMTHVNDDLVGLPTLRKARENVRWMVNDGVSLQKTRNYLHHFGG